MALFGNTAGGFGILELEDKVVLGDTSEQSLALASHDGRLFLAWKGAGNDNLNMLSSRDGLFVPTGPWYFSNLSRYGLYVAAYRTPPAQPDALVTPLESLGLLYAMGKPKDMDFETFKKLTLERNTTLPAQLEYGGYYIFHTADDHRFSFWLQPALEKYQARVARMDEVQLVADLTSLPLVEGPYLRAPGGHDGLIEVRNPGCETAPLVLDFRDPEKPVRLDNISACPGPWLDRARALFDFAQTLSKAGKHEEIAALRDRVKIYQQLVEVDPNKYGPDLASALNQLAGSLFTLVQQLIVAKRISEVSAPALESIQAYRQAAAKGADTTGVANNLLSLSQQLAGVGLSAEAISAAQAAVDVLRGVQPPTTEQATYLNLLAGSLFTLVQQLIMAKRISEISAPALEAIQVYRQAAAKGADTTGVANNLLTGLEQSSSPNKPQVG